MTLTETPPTPPPAEPSSDWRDRQAALRRKWADASATTRTRIQVGIFLAVVVVAYQYSLRTLVQSLSLDTPLAYIGLVPFIALGLAYVRSRSVVREPTIHDRQLDYIVGLPLLAAALALNVFLPRRLSAMFWVWRIDLLSLPFFVAGLMCVIFGVRAAWRQRLAIVYLLLAWPLPYSVVLRRGFDAVTSLTNSALTTVTGFVTWATPNSAQGGTLFTVVHSGKAFTMSVASACSGVNGIVGFLLVGTAFGAIVRGPRLRKTLWLVGGMVLLWAMNLTRLMLIFGAGGLFGEHFAIEVLHPFVGLITFNIGIVIMLLLLKPAGLRIASWGATTSPSPSGGTPGGGASPAVPRIYAATAVVVVVGLLLAFTNVHLRSYDLVAAADGEPKLASFLAFPASPPAWKASFSDEYTWAKPYFGEDSTWYRYNYAPTLGTSDLHSDLPVIADVVNTGDLSSFSAYGVEACYRFHGYSLNDIQQVDLGGGINGQTISYTAKSTDWSMIYWIWPVKVGTTTRYERVILYTLDTGTVASVSSKQDMKAHRDFLVAFAREVILAQAKVPVGSRLPIVTAIPNSDPDAPVKTEPFPGKTVRPARTGG
jgi:exosortase/archaeosortase family protein